MIAKNNIQINADNFWFRYFLGYGNLIFGPILITTGLIADFDSWNRVIINADFTRFFVIFCGTFSLVLVSGTLIGIIRIKKSGSRLLKISEDTIFATNLIRSINKPLKDLSGYEVKRYHNHKLAQFYILLHFTNFSFNVPLDLSSLSVKEIEKLLKSNLKY